MRILLLLVLALLGLPLLIAQTDWKTSPWPARWIGHPDVEPTGFAVLEFKRSFTLDQLPEQLEVMVSADNEYRLFVNGSESLGHGPALGDLMHWRYETYDIAPYLHEGENTITALVWNYGIRRAWNRESYRTAFLLQPVDTEFSELTTDSGWEVRHDPAYALGEDARGRLRSYVVTDPQLVIDRRKPKGAWRPATSIVAAAPNVVGTEFYWGLVPREIPLHREDQTIGCSLVDDKHRRIPPFSSDKVKTAIPPRQTRKFLFDLGLNQNFVYRLGVRGGAGSEIRIEYAESLIDKEGDKGHRDSTRGKFIRGLYDTFILAATTDTLHEVRIPGFRSGRYVEVTIETAGEAAALAEIDFRTRIYPLDTTFGMRTKGNRLRINDIVGTGLRTAVACMLDTYVDCPYYEQLQYVGDTRIQALVGYYSYDDDRLVRKAIKVFDESRNHEGLTQSRYPSRVPQFIPPYSLAWIEMLRDFQLYRDDAAFVREHLDGVESILDWYADRQLDNRLVGPTPYWNFVDWPDEWPWDESKRIGGVPDLEGGSSIISLQWVSALEAAAAIFTDLGDREKAGAYRTEAARIRQAVAESCYDPQRGLFADTPAKREFSQHANVMAVLTGLRPSAAPAIMEKVLSDPTLTPTTSYFDFFKVEALRAAGMMDRYPELLANWAAFLDRGFTTWPEKPFDTRSDCHAWSASPNYHLGSALAGIRPAGPGFITVEIRPLPVRDLSYSVMLPHPRGTITLNCRAEGAALNYDFRLPEGVRGQLYLGELTYPISSVENGREYEFSN